ncbi:MAG: heme ABC transporter ATP-binding protein, partial [Alphaproteobacteria bacterium]|nr:heme ABC transporter ATP-binding protein [Alphaproteobacteria bacterium]
MTKISSHQAEGGSSLPPAIVLSGISKTFGAVRANDEIALTVTSGHIHGIVGENGAGK